MTIKMKLIEMQENIADVLPLANRIGNLTEAQRRSLDIAINKICAEAEATGDTNLQLAGFMKKADPQLIQIGKEIDLLTDTQKSLILWAIYPEESDETGMDENLSVGEMLDGLGHDIDALLPDADWLEMLTEPQRMLLLMASGAEVYYDPKLVKDAKSIDYINQCISDLETIKPYADYIDTLSTNQLESLYEIWVPETPRVNIVFVKANPIRFSQN
jgi:hypothetical protein